MKLKRFYFCWMAEWCSIFNYRHHWETDCKSLTVSQIMPKHNNVGINKNVFIIWFGGSTGVLGMRFADNMTWITFRWQHHLHLLRRGVNVTWITFKVNVVINMLIIFRWFESALCFWTANTKETAEVFAKESKVISSHPLSSFTYFVYGHEQRKFTGKHVFMLIKYDHNISQKVFTNMMLTLQITAIIWPGMLLLLLLHSVRRCQMACPTIAASMS